MEETLRQKQLFLRENILEKGYSTDDFMDLLHSKKGEEGLDLNNWTMRELSLVVKEFISYENPYDNQDILKPNIETDEDYEQKCLQKYREQKQKENQEYANCKKIEKSNLLRNNENLKIKVNLQNKDDIKENGDFVVETIPNRFQVKRNFSDFEWILNFLNEEYFNYIIPQLSKKNYGEKYNEEKALKRSRVLKKFLEGIALHPTLKHIKIFNDFLSIDSEEDFLEKKKKYILNDQSSEKKEKEKKESLEEIKSLSGKIKISINKEKEVYFMNIKDNTKINEGLIKKINKSYKNLIEIMNNACEKMKEISDLWKLLHDKSIKYYETSYTIESYKLMNKIMEELFVSETKKISMFNTNIREYFRFIKNEFNSLNNLAIKVENYKDKYYKAAEKLKEDKEKLFKEKDISSWGLNENDLKHKNVFLNNKELAFSKMKPEETNNVLNLKNIYGVYLNSLIDEYERIRLLNGQKNKENTIKILKFLSGNFKFINISCESHIDNFIQIKDEEINENEFKNDNYNDNNHNLFNNRQYNNYNQTNSKNNFRNNINNNNYKSVENGNQNNRNVFQPQRRNNNQNNFNNNRNQINENINNRINNNQNNNNQLRDQYNINNNNQFNNQINNQYERRANTNQKQRSNNNINNINLNQNNQYRNNNSNNFINRNQNQNSQYRINNNNNIINRNQNQNQNSQYRINSNNNIQFNRNNNNQINRNRNINEYNMNNNNINNNQDNIGNINNRNSEVNNKNDYKDIFNDEEDDNFDFHINRNNDINIYES